MKYRSLVMLSLTTLLCGACTSETQVTKTAQEPQHEVEIVDDPEEVSTLSTSSTEVTVEKTDNYKYVTDDEGHQIIIVNKKYGLSPDYAPGEDPEAKAQLLNLIADMQKQGFSVSNQYSGYRPYGQQQQLYNDYVSRDGVEAADRYSARPGHSEHQSGLAYDLLDSQGNLLGTASDDGAADWLAKHAHEYGFIVRYQPGKEEQTGYMAEAWHIRYVGPVAEKIYQSHLSLEEYFGIDGGSQYEE